MGRIRPMTCYFSQPDRVPTGATALREPFQHGLTQTNILQNATARRRALLDATLRPIFDLRSR
jgi:hypothetical protein